MLFFENALLAFLETSKHAWYASDRRLHKVKYGIQYLLASSGFLYSINIESTSDSVHQSNSLQRKSTLRSSHKSYAPL